MLLVGALEEAKPGDKILLVSYGDGSDVFIFEATEHIHRREQGKRFFVVARMRKRDCPS